MGKSLLLFLLLTLVLPSCKNQSVNSPSAPAIVEHEVKLLADGKLRYLELSGSPYERGLTHGRQLRKEIHEVIDLFKKDIREVTNEDPDAFITRFLRETNFKASILKWMPEVMEELNGIAEGAGIDRETIFMHQLGDEYWFNTKDLLAHHCSSFGVNRTSDNPAFAAQNMDIPQFYHGYQTVIRIIDLAGSKEMLFLTIPGHLGITGMNNKSVSINCNTLMQLDYGRTGLPVTFIVRGVVEKNTQKEALDFLADIKHASGQNYIIGGPEEVFSIECSANKTVEFRPFDHAPFTYHTNHPMSNDDYNGNFLLMLKNQNNSLEQTEKDGFGCQRIKSFQKRFTEHSKGIGIDDIKEVLSSKDNDTGDVISNDYTYASVIYELSDHPIFFIAPGKPHEENYIEINFE
ncbi:MAG: hypothetical protein KDC80_02015 [Saprospiraceae bacterium]|nr:hypothetical protein [Saprospiraceae bacterium]